MKYPTVKSQLADLPSADAAKRLFDGEPDALLEVVGTTVLRAVLIGAGLQLAAGGVRREHIVRDSLAASACIELFVLGWFWSEKNK